LKWLPGLGSNQQASEKRLSKSAPLSALEAAFQRLTSADAEAVCWIVSALSAQRADQNGGAQRADKARQLDRNAVLGPAGEQAGGFPALGGGGRGVGDERSGENL